MKKKKFFILAAVIFTALVFIFASASANAEKMQEISALDLSAKPQDIDSRGIVKPDLNFGKFPLYFIFNKGQVNKEAKFYAKASRYTLWLTKEGLVFDSFKKVKVEVEEGKEGHTCPSGTPLKRGVFTRHSRTGSWSVMFQGLFSWMPTRIPGWFPLKRQNTGSIILSGMINPNGTAMFQPHRRYCIKTFIKISI